MLNNQGEKQEKIYWEFICLKAFFIFPFQKKKKIAVCESRLSLPYHVMSWWWHGRIWPCPSGSPQTPQLHSLALSHPSNEKKISIIISLLLILGAKLFSRTEVHGGKVTVECSMKNLICNNSLKHTLQKGQLLVT